MDTSLGKRIVSGVIAAIILLFMLYFRGLYLVIPGTAITLLAVYEFNRAFINIGYRPLIVPAMIMTVMIILVALTNSRYDYRYAVLIALVFYLVLLTYQLLSDHSLIDLMISVFSLIYVVLPMTLIMFLAMRKDYLIYLIFILAISSDTFAFIFGKLFGKTKLIEKISPKKTVEGSVGGVVGCVLATLLFRYIAYPEMGIMAAMLLGIIGSIVSQLGDLTASKIKRFCKIKDFGKIMPGHGGVLDRVDSILFTSTLVFIYYWLFII